MTLSSSAAAPAPGGGRRAGGDRSAISDRSVPTLVERTRTLTCLLVLWTVAFAQSPGKIVADTKIDLALDPWGLMSRALHLWDPSTSFGVLQNQGYGYLFPMGPFAALGQLVAPAWVVQRLWWAVLLSIGFLALRALLRVWRVADPVTRQVAALAFALSPRVVSTLGPISSESAPALLAQPSSCRSSWPPWDWWAPVALRHGQRSRCSPAAVSTRPRRRLQSSRPPCFC